MARRWSVGCLLINQSGLPRQSVKSISVTRKMVPRKMYNIEMISNKTPAKSLDTFNKKDDDIQYPIKKCHSLEGKYLWYSRFALSFTIIFICLNIVLGFENFSWIHVDLHNKISR